MNSEKYNFFLIVPPGFERVAANELRYWLPSVEINEQSRGGIGFTANFADGCELNRSMKTPSRILVRLADFGCRDFPKLFKKIKNFPWNEWLPKNSKVRVEASSHGSRLKIKKRIEKTCLDALKTNGFEPSDDESTLSIYARVNDDVCYLSLDTSGEILHKRGYRIFTPEAPIRENLAAAILLESKEVFDQAWSSNQIAVIDPMAGSGTFLIEAMQLFTENKREFAFEKFVPKIPKHELQTQKWVSEVFGIEEDKKAIMVAENALKKSGIDNFSLEQANIFGATKESLKGAFEHLRNFKKILVCNPPYGKRLTIKEPFSVYYPKLLSKFEELFSPDVISVILPNKVNLERLKIPAEWELIKTQSFTNGGFPVVLVIFRRLFD